MWQLNTHNETRWYIVRVSTPAALTWNILSNAGVMYTLTFWVKAPINPCMLPEGIMMPSFTNEQCQQRREENRNRSVFTQGSQSKLPCLPAPSIALVFQSQVRSCCSAQECDAHSSVPNRPLEFMSWQKVHDCSLLNKIWAYSRAS